MDKFHRVIIKSVMELEESGNKPLAKELLLSYMEFKNVLESKSKIRYVSSTGSILK